MKKIMFDDRELKLKVDEGSIDLYEGKDFYTSITNLAQARPANLEEFIIVSKANQLVQEVFDQSEMFELKQTILHEGKLYPLWALKAQPLYTEEISKNWIFWDIISISPTAKLADIYINNEQILLKYGMQKTFYSWEEIILNREENDYALDQIREKLYKYVEGFKQAKKYSPASLNEEYYRGFISGLYKKQVRTKLIPIMLHVISKYDLLDEEYFKEEIKVLKNKKFCEACQQFKPNAKRGRAAFIKGVCETCYGKAYRKARIEADPSLKKKEYERARKNTKPTKKKEQNKRFYAKKKANEKLKKSFIPIGAS